MRLDRLMRIHLHQVVRFAVVCQSALTGQILVLYLLRVNSYLSYLLYLLLNLLLLHRCLELLFPLPWGRLFRLWSDEGSLGPWFRNALLSLFCIVILLSSHLIRIRFVLLLLRWSLEHRWLVRRAVAICIITDSRWVSLDGFLLHGQAPFRLHQRPL